MVWEASRLLKNPPPCPAVHSCARSSSPAPLSRSRAALCQGAKPSLLPELGEQPRVWCHRWNPGNPDPDCIPAPGMFQSHSQICNHQTCSEPLGRLHTAFLGWDREPLPAHGIHPAGAGHGGTWGQSATHISAAVGSRLIFDFSPPAVDGRSSQPGLQGWDLPGTLKTAFPTGQQHPHPGLYPSKQ